MISQNSCRTLVLLSGSGSNLQALIEGQQQGKLPIDICAVISNRADAFGLVRATEAGIATECLDHRLYSSRESFDRQLLDTIACYTPELIILAGFMRVLTGAFVRHYKGRMLNIHPSLLPKYPGLNTHQRVLDNGEKQHGVTVHFVTEELDGGPAVIQAVIPVLDGDNADSLKQRIQRQEHLIYPMAVNWFASGRLQMVSDTKVLLDGKILSASGYQIDDSLKGYESTSSSYFR
jgi:phosphoribosylglycinamide formyltransferase 1